MRANTGPCATLSEQAFFLFALALISSLKVPLKDNLEVYPQSEELSRNKHSPSNIRPPGPIR